MEYLFILCLCSAALHLASEALTIPNLKNYTWDMYKEEFLKNILMSDGKQREMIFNENLAGIVEHNLRAEKKEVKFARGINKFTAMTENEMRLYRNGFEIDSLEKSGIPFESLLNDGDVTSNDEELSDKASHPESIDWREKGVVTRVKDQGSCASCWAFAAVGALESAFAIKTGKLVRLSEQNLVDCSKTFRNNGCVGGNTYKSYRYIMAHGISTEGSYPYANEEGECKSSRKYRGAKITNFADINDGNEDQLKEAVATRGPISVAIDGSRKSFYSYSNGVYYEPTCNSTHLDHGVTVVGYGNEDGEDYWIVKNSWGRDWGNNGYILMARNKNNNCGIATMAVYPIVSKTNT